MATVKAFIRTNKKDKETSIRFRISDGRNVQLYHASKLMVIPVLWDEKREQYKAKCVVRTDAYVLIRLLQSAKNCFLLFMIQISA